MSFADPLFPDRSLRDNPWLKDYYSEQDAQDESSSNSCLESSSLANNNSSNSTESNQFIRSNRSDRARDSYEPRERSSNAPHQHKNSNANDLGAKIIEIARDPFEDTWDIGRMARVLTLANSLQKDEEARANRVQTQPEANAEITQRVWDNATDSSADFGSIEPHRLRQVEALAKLIPQENHLIQTVVDSSKQKALKESEPDFNETLQDHYEKIGYIKKGALKLERFIETHIPKANPQQFDGKVSQQIIQLAKVSQEQKIQNFENLIRGVNDYAIRQCNSLLCAIPGLNHSSEDFYEKHLMSRKGDGIENSFYYWTGNAVGVLAELATLKGGTTAINIGRRVVQKIGYAAGRAGIQAAVHAKLTTGSIGRGIAQYLPREAGGGALAIHESATFASQFSKLVALKSVETVLEVLKNNSELLKKAPEIAKYIQKPVVDSQAFLRGLRNMVKSSLTFYAIEDLTVKNTISSEIDSIANQAISKASQDIAEAEAVLEDFEGVLDSLDNPANSFREYLEFAHRQQMRKFVQKMNCPKEAIPYVMEKVPERENCGENITEEIVRNILKAQDNIEYCNKHVRDPWVRDKLMQLLWSEGKLSIFGSNVEGYSEQFKTIVEQYGLDISKHWNQLRVPRHVIISKNFYAWALRELQDIHQKIQQMEFSDELQRQSKFLQQFHIRIKNTVKFNPLISHPKWYKFWKSESIQQMGEAAPIDKTTYKMHKRLQFRHFAEGGAVIKKKSLVYWDYEKIILKTEPLIGKGISVDEKKLGEKDFKEVVGFDEICGEAYDRDTLQWIKTKFAKIHYRLDGLYHIVPIKPTSSHAKQWENLHGKS